MGLFGSKEDPEDLMQMIEVIKSYHPKLANSEIEKRLKNNNRTKLFNTAFLLLFIFQRHYSILIFY